jgi:hypothetical protein
MVPMARPVRPGRQRGAPGGHRVSCAECGAAMPVRPGVSGPPPKYCGKACRVAAAKRRQQGNGSAPGPEPAGPVKDWERPPYVGTDDGHSDAASLKPPPLPWEQPPAPDAL